MHRISILLIMMVMLCLVSTTVFSAQGNDESEEIGDFLQTDQGAYLEKLDRLTETDPVMYAGSGEFNDFPMFDGDIYSSEHRSVGKAFLYSIAVPGLGEYYSGSKLKAGIFFAFDMLSWTQYLTKHSSGTKKEDEFEDYADNHWSPTEYTIWLIDTLGKESDADVAGFTHHLPDQKTQQYYEMIGKWEQFKHGWDDYDPVRDTSFNRVSYLSMREDANSKLESARTWAMVSLANHVLSAFDAALSAKRFNKKRDVFSDVNVKARMARRDGEQIPELVLTYKFY
ncbi:MAG: hypothetical protein KKH67_05240 [candidate division Zixibacteria bacterium]|nr:hypothetical protein [candidate division Zixibacteria bacterium]MBU1469159.1 hypothetical protein [candidate division Zixibacteria bacterium]